MRLVTKRSLVALLAVVSVHAAADSFAVRDIRIEGLERISPGTVFNYLPVKVGDDFNENRSSDAVRALFKTGFFRDVRLEREGDVLVVVVSEREGIAEINITGNKDIKTDALKDGLKKIGFVEGGVYDRSVLDKVEQELRRQYFSAGKYGIKIDSKVKDLGGNRVGIDLNISEGRAAKIKQINIVGNKTYSDEELIREFKLTTPTLISFFTKTDQYSKQKLSADLETLRSYYLDRGFINFNIDSTQVSITPSKSDIYITVNVTEGDRYSVSGVKLAGNLVVPQDDLFPLVKTAAGNTFSRKDVTETSTALSDRLGDDGYAFANVNAVPEINNDNKTVALTYFVDPGKRTYVRRINFAGNTKTRDEVLRREMRQMEGGWIATSKVQRSKVRLQRLGFFEEVNVETPAVPGSTDQVDVNYSVTERPAGNLMIGLGFSQVQGLIFNTNVTQDNFLGSGKRVSFAFNNSSINQIYSVGYTDPYFTDDGISQSVDLSYRETNASAQNLARYNTRSIVGSLTFGVPISEFQNINFGTQFERTEIIQPTSVSGINLTSNVVQDFFDRTPECQSQQAEKTTNTSCTFNVWTFNTSFAYDSRNKAILPDRGMLHRVRAEVSVPVLDLSFWKVNYDGHWYIPLIDDYTLALRGDIGYGDGYGSTKGLPFFENFYAGGARSVRGFRDNTLGPKDTNTALPARNRAVGGNFKVVGSAELILPIPFLAEMKSVRVSAFIDAGNVFDTVTTTDKIDKDNSFRYSAGLSGIWVSPFGLLSVSIAQPFNKKPNDQVQAFQFTFGTTF